MPRLFPAVLAGFGFALLAGSAGASNVDTFPEDPYNSRGTIENVRYLAVDPDAAVSKLVPKTPAADSSGKADLVIYNPTYIMVTLYVNGMQIGGIEPLDTAIIHGVKPGVYEVAFSMPNGFVQACRLSTGPDAKPEPILDPPQYEYPHYGAPPLMNGPVFDAQGSSPEGDQAASK